MGIVKRYIELLLLIRNQNYELMSAKKWDDTIRDIEWMQDLPGVSPGRWAVGYNYLYVMTRVLNEKAPKCVLDFGLGISSTLISQYFKFNGIEEGQHDVIEHDKDWCEFYCVKNRISDATIINMVECVEKEYAGVKYQAYNDISGVVANKKYDVISIDGPKGGLEKHSRRDVVEFLPDILNESFVIVIDDSQRRGEKATILEIKNKLKASEIDFYEGVYPGMSECTVIVSVDNKYICTL